MSILKTDRLLKILIGVLLAAFGWVVADSFQEKLILVGDRAPDFKVVTDGGRSITRSNFRGRLLVLNFWATWCPPCIEEIPSLNEFQKRLASQGVVVLGVSVDKSEKVYREFLRKANVSFQTARDPEAGISAQYGTFKFPETYVIDSSGRVVQKHIGARNWSDEQLLTEIRALL